MSDGTLVGVPASDDLDHEAATGAALYEQLFHAHFAALTRLAALLGADDPEDFAQEAYVRLHRRTAALRDPHAAVGYLRTTVVNLRCSRSGRPDPGRRPGGPR